MTSATIYEIIPNWSKKLEERNLDDETITVGRKKLVLSLGDWNSCVTGEANGFKSSYMTKSSRGYCKECHSLGYNYSLLSCTGLTYRKYRELLNELHIRFINHWNEEHNHNNHDHDHEQQENEENN